MNILVTAALTLQGIWEITAGSVSFSSNPVTFSEEEPIGTIVATTANDFSATEFVILGGNPNFNIENETGIIKTTANFNYEDSIPKSYILVVQAINASHSASQSLTVSIIDVDEPPECTSVVNGIGPSVTISETIKSGDFVYSFSASDPEGDVLNYTILSSSTSGTLTLFAINTIGDISTIRSLDYEAVDQLSQYHAVISVADSVGNTCTGIVTIHITDVNDEAPVISLCPSSPVSMDEEVNIGTNIALLSAFDNDSTDTLTFSFAIPVSNFEIHQVGNDAWIVTNSTLDYDTAGFTDYQLNIVVTDMASHTTTCNLTVSLKPVNEAPVCDPLLVAGPSVTVLETIASGTFVYKLTASDPDGDTLQYSFLPSSSTNTTTRFNLGNSGQITTASALDFENGDMLFYAVVSINDTGSPSLACTGTVTITITDVNDEVPTISPCPSSTLTPYEEMTAGTTLITLSASDGDSNDSLTFSFAVYEPSFQINQVGNTAIISNTLTLDYDNVSAATFYTLYVVITDLGGNQAICNLNVSLIPVNEDPICDAVFIAGTGPSVTIAETVSIGASIYKLTASDPDGNTLEYSFLPSSSTNTTALFSLDNLGLITTASALDFENGHMLFYAVVSINDTGSPSLACTGTVTITITDVNDEVPIISPCPSSTLTPSEEMTAGTTLITLSASDGDNNDSLTFSFAVNEPSFQISQVRNTAIISNTLPLDYDNVSAVTFYTLNVVVTDLGGNQAICNLNVSLIPVNEGPICDAVFTAGTGPSVTIAESIVVGTSVHKLTASDPDGDTLQYSFLPSSSTNTTALFNLDNYGLITTASALDFENGHMLFYAVISINDTGSPSLACTGTVTITITDVNDEVPIISPCPSSTLTPSEEMAAGTTLITLSASDGDSNDNLTFSFAVNEPSFQISQVGNTAIISNTLTLDYDNVSAVTFYTLNVVVTDLGWNQAICNLNVSLIPVNEGPICDAVFTAGTGLSVTIPETAAIGTSVYKLTASDPERNDLQYFFLASSSTNTTVLFSLDNLGLITTASTLDFENGHMLFYAVISINDTGSPSLACTGTVTITITDVNDEVPIISPCPSSTLTPYEEVAAGTTLITLSASDGDSNDSLTFSFAVNEPSFQINQVGDTAIIANAFTLDYDNVSVATFYTLNVVATDLGGNQAICNLNVSLIPVNEDPMCDAVFTMTGPSVTIPETIDIGASVYKITASDPDEDPLQYFFLASSSTNTTTLFSLDNLGLITTASALDFENGHMLFYAVVSINDTGSPSLACTGTVTITITDVNDEVPIISPCPSSTLTPYEEMTAGTTLITLSASDGDSNDILTFSFAVNEPSFQISQVGDTAIITNTFTLDYDNVSVATFYTLNVVVTDLGGNQVICNLNVSLIPVNEDPICDAEFTAGTASVDINETHDVLTAIYQVSATDPDFEDSLTFDIKSLTSGPVTGGNLFIINSATGIVYRNSSTSLDYESGYHVFKLEITVKDKGTPAPQKSCEGTLTINIIDENDELPVVSFSPENPVNVTDDILIGTVVLQMNASDKDAGDVVSFKFASPSDEFSIDPVTGILTTRKVLDYDSSTTLRSYPLQVFAIDKGFNTVTVTLTILLQPVNEPPVCTSPQFVQGTATVEIDENYSNLKSIYQVNATDPDIDDSMTFSIESQESSPVTGGYLFSIDPDTGIVFRNSTTLLDYDNTYHLFTLKIVVNDEGSPAPQMSCKGVLTITVNNLDDEAPIITPVPSDTIHTKEEVIIGTVLVKMEASDLDESDNVFFEFIDPQPLFSIDVDSGDIVLQMRLDYDSPDVAKVHLLPIRAYDNNRRHSSTYTLTVSVDDMDEAPVCDPAFTVGAGVSLVIPENFPTSASVYQILAADPDASDSIQFSITDETTGTAQYFTLDSNSGLISRSSVSPLDYEDGLTRFQMRVEVTEVGKSSPKSCTGSITINLENLNDESPLFSAISPNPLTINESLPRGTLVIKVSATDKDVDDVIYYEFVKTYAGFLIEEDTGEIKVAYPMDYDDLDTLTTSVLEIRAYDLDRVHSSTATLTVHIADINDNPPQCSRYLYITELAETSPEGTPVASLNCWDNDRTAANNILKYTMILDAYSPGRFNIADNEITIGSSLLQYDDSSFGAVHFQHVIFVKVEDNGIPRLTSTSTVIVKVTRVNEQNPSSESRTFNIFEDSPIGALVGKAKFTDDDLPTNNIKYSIVGGNSDVPPKFYIESNSGRIRLLNALDRETQDIYILTVKAEDMNNDQQTDPLRQRRSSATVTVNVMNVNDEPPVCDPEYYEQTIYSTITSPFIQLQCSDKDSPDHELSYSIVGENTQNLFELQRPDNNPAKVASTQRFQFNIIQGIEQPKEYTLLIQVTDEFGRDKHQQLTSTATVVIHVVPWTTTQPTTSTTTEFTTSVLTITSLYWSPEQWFVAVLTLAGALTVLAVSGIAWVCYQKYFLMDKQETQFQETGTCTTVRQGSVNG
ncbi:protocadherin Fat 4-like isoform X2 [Stegostoma tigrinum]|uniref:protocadherin Fat 4-like isoform X2 n=1 Tax=Stegostoma tigrinum TaxID=3053191 RepID=UPI0028706525|nr:protocadherin Fat 4-like isoform X2 [Stegostoma tigrinum]